MHWLNLPLLLLPLLAHSIPVSKNEPETHLIPGHLGAATTYEQIDAGQGKRIVTHAYHNSSHTLISPFFGNAVRTGNKMWKRGKKVASNSAKTVSNSCMKMGSSISEVVGNADIDKLDKISGGLVRKIRDAAITGVSYANKLAEFIQEFCLYSKEVKIPAPLKDIECPFVFKMDDGSEITVTPEIDMKSGSYVSFEVLPTGVKYTLRVRFDLNLNLEFEPSDSALKNKCEKHCEEEDVVEDALEIPLINVANLAKLQMAIGYSAASSIGAKGNLRISLPVDLKLNLGGNSGLNPANLLTGNLPVDVSIGKPRITGGLEAKAEFSSALRFGIEGELLSLVNIGISGAATQEGAMTVDGTGKIQGELTFGAEVIASAELKDPTDVLSGGACGVSVPYEGLFANTGVEFMIMSKRIKAIKWGAAEEQMLLSNLSATNKQMLLSNSTFVAL